MRAMTKANKNSSDYVDVCVCEGGGEGVRGRRNRGDNVGVQCEIYCLYLSS